MPRKEAKKGFCRKCQQYFYVHAHHVKPKSGFGEHGETIDLCPNCHTHIHEYMNLHVKNPDDEEEVLKVWDYWFKHVSVTFALLLAGLAYAWWWISG